MSLPSSATVSVRKAATLLGISSSSAYAAIHTGNFPTKVIQIGGRYVVPTKPLLATLGIGSDEESKGVA